MLGEANRSFNPGGRHLEDIPRTNDPRSVETLLERPRHPAAIVGGDTFPRRCPSRTVDPEPDLLPRCRADQLHVHQLEAGEVVDLTPDIQPNYEFFKSGPGYSSKDIDNGM